MAQIDFEQELYKAFGQIKDFTLGMRIAKYFYELGRNDMAKIAREETVKDIADWLYDRCDMQGYLEFEDIEVLKQAIKNRHERKI